MKAAHRAHVSSVLSPVWQKWRPATYELPPERPQIAALRDRRLPLRPYKQQYITIHLDKTQGKTGSL